MKTRIFDNIPMNFIPIPPEKMSAMAKAMQAWLKQWTSMQAALAEALAASHTKVSVPLVFPDINILKSKLYVGLSHYTY